MRTLFIYIFILFAVIACKEIYESPVKPQSTGYLVVEGVINSGVGATTITLAELPASISGLFNMKPAHQ